MTNQRTEEIARLIKGLVIYGTEPRGDTADTADFEVIIRLAVDEAEAAERAACAAICEALKPYPGVEDHDNVERVVLGIASAAIRGRGDSRPQTIAKAK